MSIFRILPPHQAQVNVRYDLSLHPFYCFFTSPLDPPLLSAGEGEENQEGLTPLLDTLLF